MSVGVVLTANGSQEQTLLQSLRAF